MNKIFISYSRSDREAVNRIVKIIEQETGANCWVADSLSHAGSYGHYWTSSLNEQRPEIAWYLFLDEFGARIADRYRFVGRSVRPVRP